MGHVARKKACTLSQDAGSFQLGASISTDCDNSERCAFWSKHPQTDLRNIIVGLLCKSKNAFTMQGTGMHHTCMGWCIHVCYLTLQITPRMNYWGYHSLTFSCHQSPMTTAMSEVNRLQRISYNTDIMEIIYILYFKMSTSL